MAADYIPIVKTPSRPQLGSQTVSVANKLIELRQLVLALNMISGHCVNASDFSILETQFGLPAGTGANFATLLGNLNTLFNTNTDVVGATRLAQLDEFQSRIAGQ